MSKQEYYQQQPQQQYQQEFPPQQQYNQNRSSRSCGGAGSNCLGRFWDSIIFGAGASIGNRIIGAICS